MNNLKNNDRRVAVLLATYNGARFLEQQIESLLNQKNVDIHIFIRDDNSNDETPKLLSQYLVHEKINIDFGNTNLGAALSFTSLILSAPNDFDYYAFCDQDDIWLEHKLDCAITKIQNQKSACMYCSALTLIDQHNKIIGELKLTGIEKSTNEIVFQNFATGNTIVMNKKSFNLLQQTPPHKKCIMHDWWTALLFTSQNIPIIYDQKSYILYRQHEKNLLGIEKKSHISINNFLKLRHRIKQALIQLQSLSNESNNNWKNKNLMQQANEIASSKNSYLKRLKLALSGKIKGRTTKSTIALSIAFILFS